MLSWPNTNSYKIAWGYPQRLLSYGSYKNVWKELIKGYNLEAKKGGAIILVRVTSSSSWPNTHSYKIAWRYPQRFWVTANTRMFRKNKSRGKTWKVRKGEQLFLYTTSPPDLIHIPIKLHEDIPNGYWVTANTRMLRKKLIKGTKLGK